MFDSRIKKKKFGKRDNFITKNQYFITLVGLAVLFWLSFPLLRSVRKQATIRQEINSLQEQIKDFQGKNSDLHKLLDYFQSDEFVDEQARVKLNYRKPGEDLVVIKGNGGDKKKQDKEKSLDIYNIAEKLKEDKSKKQSSNVQKWWNYFFAR